VAERTAPWHLPDGTLLRATKVYRWGQKTELLQGVPAYAVTILTPQPRANGNTLWLDDREIGVGIISSDEYEIVDPDDDQVPGEVWAKLALYRLTGDVS
jgi:hypothetical protein